MPGGEHVYLLSLVEVRSRVSSEITTLFIREAEKVSFDKTKQRLEICSVEHRPLSSSAKELHCVQSTVLQCTTVECQLIRLNEL